MPTTRRRRRVLGVVLAAAAVAAGWALWLLYRAPDRTDLATYWALVVAVVAVFVTLLPLARGSADGDAADGDDHVQEELAKAVAAQWEGAATERGLRHPEAVAVRWTLDHGLVASLAGALGTKAFPELEAYPVVDGHVLERGGDVRELHRLSGGLRSGRLVVAGPPGSGKSAAAVFLVVDCLRHRRDPDVPDARAIPVPVLFSVGGWDPRSCTLQDWVVAQLRQTYDELLAGRRGARTALRLVEAGRVTVVLDGVDEMPDGLRADAFEKINKMPCRVVVTGRRDELAAALRRQTLYGAVVVGLEPVSGRTAAAYLSGFRTADPSSPYGMLLDRVQGEPFDPLAEVLDTPLMITLVRDGLPDDEAVAAFLALVDREPAPGPQELQNHLVDRLVDAAYRRPGDGPSYDVATARRTLEWVATRMRADGAEELAWWHLPRWAPSPVRTVLVGVAVPVVMFGLDLSGLSRTVPGFTARLAVLGAVGGLLGAWSATARAGEPPLRRNTALGRPGPALGYGLALGCLTLSGLWATGVPFPAVLVVGAACVAVGIGLTVVPWAGTSRRRPLRVSPVSAFLVGLVGGWAAMNVFLSRLGTGGFLLPLLAVSLAAIVLALRLGLGAGTVPDTAATPATPSSSYRRGRSTELAGWCLLAVPCGTLTLVGSVLLAQIQPYAGLVGFGVAVLAGAALGLIFPEAWLTACACVQLAVRHRLPVRLLRFLDDAQDRGVLRAVGPTYEFRHARLQDRLVETAARRPPRYPPTVQDEALRVLRERAGGTDHEVCRFAWWRIPTWTSSAARAAGVGLAAGVVTWVGLGLLARPLSSGPVGVLYAVAAAAGAALGAVLLGRRLAAAELTPQDWASYFRRPVALGVALGLTLLLDVWRIPSDLVILFPIGMLTGAAFWLLLRVVPVRTGPAPSGRRRAGDVPSLLRVILGMIVGVLAMLAVLAVAPPLELPLYLVVVAAAVVVGLRFGLGRSVLCGSSDRKADVFTSWGRHRTAQLAVWVATGIVAVAFVVRTGSAMVVYGLLGTPPGPLATFVAGVGLWFVGGLVLGLTFPVTWLLSLACVELRVRHGVPLPLMRVLREARDRGALRTDGPGIELPAGTTRGP